MAVALFGSFVSLYYYLIVLKVIFVDQSSDSVTRHSPAAAEPSGGGSQMPVRLELTHHFVAKATIALLAAVVLFLGIMPQALAAKIIASLP